MKMYINLYMEMARTWWWMILLRGIALLVLGILAVAWSGITLIVLSYIFALYVLTLGILNTIHGVSGVNTRRGWFVSLLLGIAQIAVSIYVLRSPILTLAVFVLLVGFTFMLQGVLEIIIAFIEEDLGSRVFDSIGGVLGIIAGFFIVRYPIAGGLTFVWVMGIYGIIVGSIVIATALGIHAVVEKEVVTKSGRRALVAH